MPGRSNRAAFAFAAFAAIAGPACGHAAEDMNADVLRVCADPNNLPFSNQAKQGFENRLADMMAAELGRGEVSYTWWAQRRGFIRNTLKAGDCDVVIGVPAKLEMVATTRAYYRSSYVFVTRADRHIDMASLADPRLKSLRIGVHLIGDDGANTPPATILGHEGIVDNVVGYTIYGDYREPNPPARLIQAVVDGDIDIAAAWGPLAGYFAGRSPVPLTVRLITDRADQPAYALQFDVAMGVRKQDKALRAQLDRAIARRQADIEALLKSYGVPLLPPLDGGSESAQGRR
ncbi:MAG TPA: substrate-binding domain-containing protein [Ferrovibrio sp.]|uniref:substrate-binding domain-containing protein n=1 Tax=Ferrovibrio sp. TaxID=1917215 RepID=UPI002ED4BAF8